MFPKEASCFRQPWLVEKIPKMKKIMDSIGVWLKVSLIETFFKAMIRQVPRLT